MSSAPSVLMTGTVGVASPVSSGFVSVEMASTVSLVLLTAVAKPADPAPITARSKFPELSTFLVTWSMIALVIQLE